jgi:cytochrome c553
MTARAPLITLVLLAASLPAQGADAPPGATMCSGCHLPAGSVTTSIPVINGRDAVEIATIMEEFRGGKRPATVMDRIAKGFAPDEVQTIAAWLAEQK